MQPFEILKPLNDAQKDSLEKARANPELPGNQKVLSVAQEKGYIRLTGPAQEAPPNISELDSVITGASVGGSFGLARPMLTGAGMATGLPAKEAWQKSGEFIKEAGDQNPWSYMGGIIGGMAVPVSGAIKGGAAALKNLKYLGGMRPALATTMASMGASGAMSGGISGAKGDPLETVAEEIIKGMAYDVVGRGVGAGLRAGFKKALPGIRNIPEDVMGTYEKNRKSVNTLIGQKMASFVPELADDTASRIKEVSSSLESQLQEVAQKSAKPIQMKPVLKVIENQFNKLDAGAVTPAKESAAKTIYNTWSKLSKRLEDGRLVTAEDLVTMKRDFQAAAEAVYEGQAAGPVNEAYASIAKATADALKKQVPGTGDILAAEQAAIKAKQMLGLTGNADTSQALNRMRNLLSTMLNPAKRQAGVPDQVQQFDRIFGTKLYEASKLFRAASALGNADIISGFKTGARSLLPAAGYAAAGPLGMIPGMLIQTPAMTRPLITGMKMVPGLGARGGLLKAISEQTLPQGEQ